MCVNSCKIGSYVIVAGVGVKGWMGESFIFKHYEIILYRPYPF